MFVGEAPGFHEDKQGVPFVGAAGQLLGKLLERHRHAARGRLHRERAQVPPSGQPRPAARGDRGLRGPPLQADRADPAEGRRDARELLDEAALRQAARDHARARAVEQEVDARRLDASLLYPLFHPAAALYTPRMLDVLEADFRRLPELLGRTRRTARGAGPRRRADRARRPGGRRAGAAGARCSSASSERRGHYACPCVVVETGVGGGDRGARRAARGGRSSRATSSRSRASSAPARRPSSAAPAASSASTARCRAPRSRSATATTAPVPVAHLDLYRVHGPRRRGVGRPRAVLRWHDCVRRVAGARAAPGCRRCGPPSASSTSTSRTAGSGSRVTDDLRL